MEIGRVKKSHVHSNLIFGLGPWSKSPLAARRADRQRWSAPDTADEHSGRSGERSVPAASVTVDAVATLGQMDQGVGRRVKCYSITTQTHIPTRRRKFASSGAVANYPRCELPGRTRDCSGRGERSIERLGCLSERRGLPVADRCRLFRKSGTRTRDPQSELERLSRNRQPQLSTSRPSVTWPTRSNPSQTFFVVPYTFRSILVKPRRRSLSPSRVCVPGSSPDRRA